MKNLYLSGVGLSVLLLTSPCGAQSETGYSTDHLEFSNLVVEEVENPLGPLAQSPRRRITGTITNTGGRTLTRVDVVIYYQDADGRDVGELELENIVNTETQSGDPSPLRPGYVRDFSTPARYAPSAWDGSSVRAEASHVVFEDPEVTAEGLNVRIEGLHRDYPEYYNNIIRQIQRCFSWREGGGWQTTVFFYVDRQGNAEDIEFVTRSGNSDFDFAAVGAVECGSGRFGPLPDDLPYERFPVRFNFRPMGSP